MKISEKTRGRAFKRIQTESFLWVNSCALASPQEHQEHITKFIYSSVMCLLTEGRPTSISADWADEIFLKHNNVMALLGLLTPTEFERMFPIIKDYDGERWGYKDYFSCKKMLKLLPENEPISNNIEIFEFLWDYHNNTTRELLMSCMGCMDNIRQLNGGVSMMEEFAVENDIETYEKFNGAKGKEYIRNKSTGEIQLVKKPLPRYLKVVK